MQMSEFIPRILSYKFFIVNLVSINICLIIIRIKITI